MAHLKACNDRLNLAQSLQKNKTNEQKILKILDANSLDDQENGDLPFQAILLPFPYKKASAELVKL